MAALIIIAVVVFIVVMTVYYTKKNKELIAEGKIIQRDGNFVETAEIFTLHNVNFSQVIDALKETNFAGSGVSLNGSVQQGAVNFQCGNSWSGQLVALKSEADTYSYMFTFTKWQTRSGMPQNVTSMNVALTALEKMFLRLDPNTKVESRRNKVKTTPKFF